MPNVSRNKPVGPLVATISIAAVAAAALLLSNKFALPVARLIVRTADGQLHWCGINGKPGTLTVFKSFATHGTGLPNWSFDALWLSPDQAQVLVREIELLTDAVDIRLTVYQPNGTSLFSRTDNAFPTGEWTSQDAPVPAWLTQVQAQLDAEWTADGKQGPRPIAGYRFIDSSGLPDITSGGWLATGFVVDGECPTELLINGAPQGSEMAVSPWRAIVVPQNGVWTLKDAEPGPAPPPGKVVKPVPPLSRPVTLASGTLKIGGVAQNPPQFGSGVTHFAGPYLG